MTDIFSLKVEDIVSKIKDAQLTSVEVCQKYIERIDKFEKVIFEREFSLCLIIYQKAVQGKRTISLNHGF